MEFIIGSLYDTLESHYFRVSIGYLMGIVVHIMVTRGDLRVNLSHLRA